MPTLVPLVPIILVVSFAVLVRSTLGFGDALIAMPLLALLIGPQQAAPLVACLGPTISTAILLKQWRAVDIQAAWRLILASLLGIPLGILLVREIPEGIVNAAMGGLLFLFGWYNLVTPRLPTLEGAGWAYGFGFVAGILGGAYNINGPPVIVYSALRRWPSDRFRATLQGYFFPTGLLILIGHGVAGSLAGDVLRFYGYSLPFILLAIFAGGWLSRRIPRERFTRIVYGFLILIGVYLFVA